MTEVINLSNNVIVSDPCYSIPTWCQTVLTDVLPGRYISQVNEDPETGRCAELLVIHEDYYQKHLDYQEHSQCGVDSGQLGVFDAASYRSDAAAADIQTPPSDFFLPRNDQDGDAWYEKICKITLDDPLQWGSYDTGVVSSTGWGDGVYPLQVARNESGQIVAMQVTFMDLDEDEDDYLMDEDNDCCNECGAELESDGSCNYCEHFENSKKED